jgi:hypothetical protein
VPIIRNTRDIPFQPFHLPAARWFAAPGPAGLPDIRDVPDQNDPLASYRILAEIAPEPLKVLYREVGHGLEALYGEKMSGKTLDELYNDWFRKRAYEGYQTAIEERLPVYIRRGTSAPGIDIGYHALYLPCGGSAVTGAVTYVVPTDARIKTRDDWEKALRETPWF